MQKICIICGEAFEAKRSDAVCCSRKCRDRKRNGSFTKKICKICGKEFNGGNNELYCNDDCKDWALEIKRFRSNEDRNDYLDVVCVADD